MPVALEWGPVGARTLAERSDVVVVVDVLSFSTALTIAVERGAKVWPHTGGESARQLARDIDAVLAGNRSSHEGLTLSPASLLAVDGDTRLVLPSPNGSSIAFAAVNGEVPVVAGCLRNATAVARFLKAFERVALVPAGEQWADGSLRPAYEDLVGAGAIVDRLVGSDPAMELSPEAEVALLAFQSLRPLERCPSGAELVERGFAEDVRIAGEIDAKGVMEKRTVLRLDPRLAPVKVAVLPLSRNADLTPKAKDLAATLRGSWNVEFDDAGAIGRRYRRQDEIGTPFCVTVDFDSLDDQAATVRERDSMKQERIGLDAVHGWLAQRLLGC